MLHRTVFVQYVCVCVIVCVCVCARGHVCMFDGWKKGGLSHILLGIHFLYTNISYVFQPLHGAKL